MLFDAFWLAGAVYSVKASFVPISGDMKAETTTVQHRGGPLDGECAANGTSGALS